MDISILTALGAGLIGLLLGWLIASLRQQQQQTEYETQRRLLEQSLEQLKTENDTHKIERQSGQQQLREAELELRKLHSLQAASQEKLQLLVHWQNECDQLNQELRAQRKSTVRRKLSCVRFRPVWTKPAWRLKKSSVC